MYRNVKNTYENYTEKCSVDSECYFDFSSLRCKTYYSGDSNSGCQVNPNLSNILDCKCSTPQTTATPKPVCPNSLPNASDITESSAKCTTSVNKLTGNCISKSKCTGGIFNGYCRAKTDYCCVDEVNPPLNTNDLCKTVTLTIFKTIFKNISAVRAEALYPYFLSSLSYAEITTCKRLAAYCAQVSYESGGLLYFEEIDSGAAYEGRADLGNIYKGDGTKYKGRGPIQLTGRSNYTAAGNDLRVNFVDYPELVSLPSFGFLTTAWYWKNRNLNTYADSGDFKMLTKRINGGYNGLADREALWATCKKLLGC